jgi:hypothetical protein
MTDTLIRGHLDQVLTNFSLTLAKQQGFIGDIVAPVVRVSNESDAYAKFGAEDLRLDAMGYGGKGLIGRSVLTETLDQFLCQEYTKESAIPWQKLRNADASFRLETRATQFVINNLKLRREKQVADLMATAATFTNTAALSGADCWDKDTSSPVAKIADGKETIRALIGVEPNTLVLGPHVWAHLRINPDVCQRVFGLLPNTPATVEQAAAVLGVDRILVGKGVYRTDADDGTAVKAATLADVWGKIAVLCYIDSIGAEGTITPAVQFECDAVAAPFSTFTYEENQSRMHVIQGFDCVDVKAVAASAAYLYTTVVA